MAEETCLVSGIMDMTHTNNNHKAPQYGYRGSMASAFTIAGALYYLMCTTGYSYYVFPLLYTETVALSSFYSQNSIILDYIKALYTVYNVV